MQIILISDTKLVADGLTAMAERAGAGSVLVIDAAAPDPASRGGSAAALYREIGLDVTVTDPLTEPMPDLDGFDLLHLSGGNPFRLLAAAQEIGLKEMILERAAGAPFTLVGSSAGAMVLGRDISHARILMPDLGLTDSAGFGWIDGPVMPHMDMSGWRGDVIRAHVADNPDPDWVWLCENSFECRELFPEAELAPDEI
ncbi:Type 1 glutamine amidotransferase-like domain-containing protein [Cereibacter sphaeroides]|uniref:Type 1 glutamine amidotransferase-like domain-containing protein n=1 Tax=Cereibacter sphaeroides TaxID=1063 RepID=UPI001F26DEE6|nr:Type 1 glutamine amidotransferase-like domain-containing protein [Cereibacter sphaeroides]MCE6958547.1 Type 1 glutamine amidotransferase-like domain-containing protein [Cereibacter sphaeroides]MCE6972790.1 Type 1 glutamine amidotransferase-like domain-containing protein [Cereibacter sphaeroides]